MSASLALAAPAPFEFAGQTYLLSPWVYDVQAAYEAYFKAHAFKEISARRKYSDPDDYQADRDGLRRDVDVGLYDFGGELVQKSLNAVRHQKELIFLALAYATKDKPVTRDLVAKIFEDPDANQAIWALVAEVNRDPNSERPTPGTA